MSAEDRIREYLDGAADCGHRLGALVFTPEGLRCPACWFADRRGTPLKTED